MICLFLSLGLLLRHPISRAPEIGCSEPLESFRLGRERSVGPHIFFWILGIRQRFARRFSTLQILLICLPRIRKREHHTSQVGVDSRPNSTLRRSSLNTWMPHVCDSPASMLRGQPPQSWPKDNPSRGLRWCGIFLYGHASLLLQQLER